MPTARSTFYERIAALSSAISHESIVAGPPNALHDNARARVMRNGLAVICFSIIEDFFRSRAQEVLGQLGRFGLRFGQLPLELRNIATIKALRATIFQLSIKDTSRDDILFVQEKARSIASTLTSSFEFADLAFGYDSSNISQSAIEHLLSALGIDKPWESLGQVAARVGIGTLGQRHRAAFSELADRRHRAAHDPRSDIQPTELQSGLLDTIGLAVGFDALISIAGYRFQINDKNVIDRNKLLNHKDVNVIYVLRMNDSRFGVKIHGSNRMWRCYSQEELARNEARRLCVERKHMMVTLDSQKIPSTWDFPAFGN